MQRHVSCSTGILAIIITLIVVYALYTALFDGPKPNIPVNQVTLVKPVESSLERGIRVYQRLQDDTCEYVGVIYSIDEKANTVTIAGLRKMEYGKQVQVIPLEIFYRGYYIAGEGNIRHPAVTLKERR